MSAPTRRTIFGFPDSVNEKAARTVAGGVLLLSLLTLALSLTAAAWLWLSAVISVGFLARVLAGPTLSPLGQLATRVVAPHLGVPKMVAGPPKRFAQGVGLAVTTVAVAALALGHPGMTQLLLGLMVVAAGLESIFAFCVGCTLFRALMRLGVIPEKTCEACNAITRGGSEPQSSAV